MKGADFIDTNIIVYAYDNHFPDKQQRAREVIISAVRNGNGVLSTQVLGEFFTVVTRKIKMPLSVRNARGIIKYMGHMRVQEIDLLIVERAIDTLEQYKISYWDSLIIAAAEGAQCKRILSEDLNAEQKYHGIEIINPFI
ncbi:MAG: PIN domain-containing protein [Calditrichia bacterium]